MKNTQLRRKTYREVKSALEKELKRWEKKYIYTSNEEKEFRINQMVREVEYAKEQGNKIIGMTGFSGGKLKELSDISLHAPINSMQVTEDIHMIFDHLMMSMFYQHLCGKNHLKK